VGISESTGEPLVSVVIPTYNRWPMVCESIDSALAQDYPALEVIVVDDGSSDGTAGELPKHYAAEQRMRYVGQENAGPAAARNTGIRQARGKYVAFLDSDDLWLAGKTQAQVDALERGAEFAAAYGICLLAGADGKPTGEVLGNTDRGRSGDNFERVLRLNPMQTSAVMVRRDLLAGAVGCFDEAMLSAQDVDLWLRITMSHPVAFVSQPLALLREHGGRWTHHVVSSGIRGRAVRHMLQKLLADLPPERKEQRGLIQACLAQNELVLACHTNSGASWPDLEASLGEAMEAHWEHLETYQLYEALVRALHGCDGFHSGGRREHTDRLAQLVKTAGDITLATGRRRAAMLYAAATRRAVSEGDTQYALGSVWLGLHAAPLTCLRHLLPAALDRLRRLGTRHKHHGQETSPPTEDQTAEKGPRNG